ncbi:hypothetical protein AMECASPLE_012660 [Ameca splendens]|uniref:Uncharacterized protein n=1 Tax=Ameca splendens TaxID=208324 RepID=A0ABV0Z0L0_9TELE
MNLGICRRSSFKKNMCSCLCNAFGTSFHKALLTGGGIIHNCMAEKAGVSVCHRREWRKFIKHIFIKMDFNPISFLFQGFLVGLMKNTDGLTVARDVLRNQNQKILLLTSPDQV